MSWRWNIHLPRLIRNLDTDQYVWFYDEAKSQIVIVERRFTVYRLACTVNGRQYIGATEQSLADCLKSHHYTAANDPRDTSPLHQDLRHYGPDAFTIKPLAVLPSRAAADDALPRLIAQHRTTIADGGYNRTARAAGRLGTKNPRPRYMGMFSRGEIEAHRIIDMGLWRMCN